MALVSADLQLSVRLLADILDIYNADSSLYCFAKCLPLIFHFCFCLSKAPKIYTCSFCLENTISQALTWPQVMKSHWPQPRHSCLYSLMIKSRWKVFDANVHFFAFVFLLSIVSTHWNKPGSGGSEEAKWLWVLPWPCCFDHVYRHCSFLSSSGFWDHGRKENTFSTWGKEICLFVCFASHYFLCYVLFFHRWKYPLPTYGDFKKIIL